MADNGEHLFDPDEYLARVEPVDPVRPAAVAALEDQTGRYRTTLKLASLAEAQREESDVVTPAHVRRAITVIDGRRDTTSARAQVALAMGTLLAGGGISATVTALSVRHPAVALTLTSFALDVVGFLVTGIAGGVLWRGRVATR